MDSLLKVSKDEYNSGNFQLAKECAADAKRIAIYEQDAEGLAWAHFRLANAFFGSDNFVSAKSNYEKAIELADLKKDSILLSSAFSMYGVLLVFEEQHKEAATSLEKALQIAIKIEDTARMRSCYEHLGVCEYMQGELRKALNYQFKALDLASALKNQRWQAFAYQNIGLIYSELGEFGNAERYTNKAIELRTELEDWTYVNECLKNLCYIYLDSGAADAAREAYGRYSARFAAAGPEADPLVAEFSQAYVQRMDSLRHEEQRTWQERVQRLESRQWMFYSLMVLMLLAGAAIGRWWWMPRSDTIPAASAQEAVASETPFPLPGIRKRLVQQVMVALAPIHTINEGRLMKCYILDYHGWAQKDIASALGVSTSAVSKYLRQCRDYLGVTNLRVHAIEIGIAELNAREIHEIFDVRIGKSQKTRA